MTVDTSEPTRTPPPAPGRHAAVAGPPDGARAPRAPWRASALTWVIAVLGIGGLVAGLYPMSAAWLSSFNQSRVISTSVAALEDLHPSADEQLAAAAAYNAALSAGVVLGKNANVPVGDWTLADQSLDYDELLAAGPDGLMSRIKIDSIGVDLPVYHGTSDEVLARGSGHLEGSHLPIGGPGTRAVLTAHRGLANATMFTDLDRVAVGDTFTVETLGRVLSYRVRDTQVIDPDETGTLRAESGEDLVTLITCTPLGINTHRILVTGERITPTPVADLNSAGAESAVPGFPWWIVFLGTGAAIIIGYVIRQGRREGAARAGAVESRGVGAAAEPTP
ncbi:class C sortase [Leucobacter luti]|uniref:Sortase A n=1 Tax=Leucobacter luti TaxID=340320 RepID=A0A4Q7U189_9MICO|nr:class C sortase [Leucobacter luti]MBL3699632.1 class C sortase [Leucobacter luti]RZT67144.1 sortase A [Leucobacter luti]